MRTPKFHVETGGDGWQRSAYRLPLDRLMIGEALLFLYALCAATVAIASGRWTLGAFLSIYVGGFALMVGVGLWQARPRRAQEQSTAVEARISIARIASGQK